MINVNLVFLLVSCSLLILIISLLTLLFQLIMGKKSPKKLYPGGKKVTAIRNHVPFVPLSIHRILLASGVRRGPGKKQASVKTNSLNSKVDKLEQFMMIKGLYDCVKIIKKPTRKPDKDSDSDGNN
uniref:Predicted gene 28269 n=1 Tax=Mus spicilegus TaxID=10103 RepID=A0A8C6G5D8_MUSSI